MLDSFRNNSQSWYVKLIFGIIIVVFIFWGIGLNQPSGNVIATVNGDPILPGDFERAFQAEAQALQESLPNTTADQLIQMGLGQKVLNDLVLTKLMEQESAKIGLTVSPYLLRQIIESDPVFAKDGKFDAALYKEMTATIGTANYEKRLRSRLLPAVFFEALTAGAYADPAATRDRFFFEMETRTMDYVLFSAADYPVSPTQEQVEATYQERLPMYAVSPTVELEYLLISPQALAKPELVDEATLEAEYNARIANFTLPARVKARHIIIGVPENASEEANKAALDTLNAAKARIEAGENFADVAKEISQDASAPQGGDLGWFTHAQMVPAFADAAFSLPLHTVSDPVRSNFGYHLIYVEEKADAIVQAFEDVKDTLAKTLAEEAVEASLQGSLDTALMQTMAQNSLTEAAATLGIQPITTGPLTAEEVVETFQFVPADVQLLMSTEAGKVVGAPLTSTQGSVIAFIKSQNPASTKTLEEVEKEIIADLSMTLGMEKAKEAADAARAKFQNNTLPDELASQVLVSQPFDRSGAFPELGYSANLATALFSQNAPASAENTPPTTPTTPTDTAENVAPASADIPWLPGVYQMEKGYILARLNSVIPATDEYWQQLEPLLAPQIRDARAEQVFNMYLAQLRDASVIKVLTPSILPSAQQ